MVSHPGAGGVRPFLKLIEVQALRGAADRDLLRRFAAARDEAAFRVIAERHGPMVFGVCARLLGNRHDAEDALQATFLVFARRAACVRNSESLASWLHGVARRVATRLRRADRRRVAREHATAAPEQRPPADDLAWGEVRAGLDEELARLPEAYREVLVLCYLEGLTRDEAGQRLGIDAGAVKGRLERGRRLLGERLTRRGIGLSAALAGLATAPPLTAALRVGRLAADPSAASPRAAALTHEFLKGVAMSKFKFVTAGLVGAVVLAAGVGVTTAQPPGKQPPAVEPKQPLGRALGEKVVPDTDEAFIRRVSKDLRGTDPTPAEVHFFLATKDANKRATLVDLFVKERADKAGGEARTRVAVGALESLENQFRSKSPVERARALEEQARAVAEADAARARAEADYARAALEKMRAGEEQERAATAAMLQRYREAVEALKGKATDPAAKSVPPPPVPPKTPPTPAVAPPVRVPATPPAPPVGALPPVPAPPAAPAANVEALRVRVQLAELTVREKMLAVREAEEQVKTGAATPRTLDRARLEVERAQLLVREAALTLEVAERATPRPTDARPTADPRPLSPPPARPR